MAITCEECYRLKRHVKVAEQLLKQTKDQFNDHVESNRDNPGHARKRGDK